VAIPIRIVAAVATLNKITWSRRRRSGARSQRPCATITAPLVKEIEAMDASASRVDPAVAEIRQMSEVTRPYAPATTAASRAR
jgi:hypothetical protein